MFFPSSGEIAEMVETVEQWFAFRSNADCTLYNKYIVNHAEVYHRTQIPVVAWLELKAVAFTGVGTYLAEDKVEVKIPFSRTGYVQPIAWLALTNKAGTWTLREGDILVRGLITDELTATGFTWTDLKKKYDHVLQITRIEIKDKGLVFKHWKIGAK